MKIFIVALLAGLFFEQLIWASNTVACQEVRIADIGWTDVSATTAVTAQLLKALGYRPKISLVATPIAFAALKNNDLDIFLGNWMPSMEADIRPYLKTGSVVQLAKNLSGARYTLAVPRYVHEAGVRSFSDLQNYKDRFKKKIYAIEAGNDGNRLILKMISDNAYALGDFEIIESSEQGMLMSVASSIEEKEWIVFLGWAPHPMNLSLNLEYLQGGEEYFGPNFGASEVFTVVRKDFEKDCPKLAAFLKTLIFDINIENEVMRLILNEKMTPEEAALSWLFKNQEKTKNWLNAQESQQLKRHLELLTAPSDNLRIPLGAYMERAVLYLTQNYSKPLQAFSDRIEKIIRAIIAFLVSLPWIIIVIIFAALSYIAQRNISLSIITFGGFILIISMGLWVETIETLVLVIFASSISIILGVPVGILSAHNKFFHKILRPVLDLMQTIPTFVYLIPTLMLFGLGMVPGLISTIIFAIAAPIRLTYLGISSLPDELNEAALSFGASTFQRLIKVEIPHALPSIMAGFTQCIMLSLSMVVIAALVGADGLGGPVVRALNTVNIRQGFESGVAIVILAIVLDRTLSMPLKKN